MKRILLIDDEKNWLLSFKRMLAQWKIESRENIFTAQTAQEALDILDKHSVSVVFLDLNMGNESGQDILRLIKNNYPHIVVIIMTGISSIQAAAYCMQHGADDYLLKTSSPEEVMLCCRQISAIQEIVRENNALKQTLLHREALPKEFSAFITVSEKMHTIFRYITAIANSSQPVLITGESGVGKGVLAKITADLFRRGEPFASLNIAGLDSQMFSDTLFGHTRGAFTGAESSRDGIISQAGNGVVFLDEIGELPLPMQLKLLYIAQDGEYRQLGSDQTKYSKARFIFATNQNLAEKVQQGKFRNDLYYRLKTYHIHIPPLRERPEDIPALFKHFVETACRENKRPLLKISGSLVSLFRDYVFPGNVRELRAMVYGAIAGCGGNLLTAGDFKPFMNEKLDSSESFIDTVSKDNLPTVNELIDQLIEKAMILSGNNQKKAAALIGMSQSTISRKLKGIR